MVQNEIMDRDTYKRIKNMNRAELTRFILKYGDELLCEQGNAWNLAELEVRLSNIKGIGGKRLKEIMAVIENYVEE